MARLELIEPSEQWAADWNALRVLANGPGCLAAWLGFTAAMRRASLLTRRTREMVILRVGALCECEYEWRRHVIMARDAGLTDQEIGRLRTGDTSGLSAAESAAVRLAEAVEHKTVDEASWTLAAEHFSPAELIEITMLAGMYGLVGRLFLSLDVDLDADLLEVII